MCRVLFFLNNFITIVGCWLNIFVLLVRCFRVKNSEKKAFKIVSMATYFIKKKSHNYAGFSNLPVVHSTSAVALVVPLFERQNV